MDNTKIYQTTEYGMLRLHPRNRLVRDIEKDGFQPRKDLMESMREKGFMVERPILVYLNPETELMTIVDGHNRLVAAMSLGIPVYYQVGTGIIKDPTDIPEPKAWKILDRVRAEAVNGNPHYAELLEFHRNEHIPLQQAAQAMRGGVDGAVKLLVGGNFTITDRFMPQNLVAVLGHFPANAKWARSASSVKAVIACLRVKELSLPQLMSRLDANPELLEKRNGTPGYLSQLETVYNRRSKEEQKIALVDLARRANKKGAA